MNILLLRTSALGDVVHALPVLRALRRTLPHARLGWVVEAAMAPLLRGHPDLDAVIEVRLRSWRHRPLAAETRHGVRELFAAIDRLAPDVTLDLMGNHKAGLLGALTLCDRRLGPERRARREPSSALWLSEGVPVSGVHAVDRGLSLLAALGIEPAPADFGGGVLLTQVPADTERWLDRQSRPFALLHPGAAWANKRYPPERWGAVARELRERADLETWVATAPGEEDLAAAVVTASASAARAVEAPSLAALAALIRRSAVVLGGDTGPLHLAHALGSPVVFVMGPTDPARHGPYGSPQAAVFTRLPCSFCYRRLPEVKACLHEVHPGAVVDNALHRLGLRASADV